VPRAGAFVDDRVDGGVEGAAAGAIIVWNPWAEPRAFSAMTKASTRATEL
jgi:hypothetical protein